MNYWKNSHTGMHRLVVHLLCASTSNARLATKYTPKLKDAYVVYLAIC
jgi:hypothetical protein